MRCIDIRELPAQSDDEIRAGETDAVERDDEVLGYFVPRRKSDPQADQEAATALARRIADLRARGWLDEDEIDEAGLLKRDVVQR